MQNFALQLEKTLAGIFAAGKRPRLLLHACCAPCSSYTLEYLSAYFGITLYYYNPNISPREEYILRANELSKYIGRVDSGRGVCLLIPEYDPAPFLEIARGLEDLPEGGERCKKCYRLRLAETAKAAAKGGFDYFCTTLSISPYKNAASLNAIGGELAEEYGVPYLFSDFKKKGGYARSIELSRQYGLYRQNYCGCIYSKLAAQRRQNEHS
ncbi:MAG: epoxyqueuosine reductase QueH [Clostridia bacterium]|nr:epoxyqueuosine reductase QueH [Clostridia bacterium]